MAVLEIIKYGHPTLIKKAVPIKNIDDKVINGSTGNYKIWPSHSY